MTPEPGNNGQLKMALAFVLGLGVAGLGAWIFTSSRDGATPQTDSRIAVTAPAVEAEPVAATPAEPEPNRPVRTAASRPEPATRPATPTRIARSTQQATFPAPPQSNQAPAETAKPAPSEPQSPALPEVVRREQPRLEAAPPQPAAPSAPPAPPAPASVTIKAGTTISIRLAERITTEKHKSGDTFSATLAQPLVVDGFVIADRNASVKGRIAQSERAGRVEGTSALSLELTQLTTSDGQHVQIRTAPYLKQGETSHKDDAKKVAIGSVVGAAIGAIAGGGKGAAIGAGAGAGAGAGTVAVTRGKDVDLPVETRISFNLSEAVTLTEKLNN